MMLLATSVEYLQIPVRGPVNADLTVYPVSVALMPDNGTEPGAGDWKAAAWLNGEVSLLLGPSVYPAGQYMAYVKVTAAPETVCLRAGRVRIGDLRT
jgi:hypothetical protein